MTSTGVITAEDGSVIFDLSVNPRLSWAAAGPFNKVLHIGPGFARIRSNGTQVHHHADQYGDNLEWRFNLLDDDWPIPENEYDMVCMFHVLEHLPVNKTVKVLQNIRRITRPTGVLILEVPYAAGLFKEIHEEGNYGMMEAVYGHTRYPGDNHVWAYYGPDLICLLHNAGWDRTWCGPAKCYHKAQQPSIRVEATHYSGDNSNWAIKREEERASGE